MYFTDVYISGLGYEGTVYISNPKGISKLKGLYIPDNTKIKVSDNNLYIKCGGAGNTKKTGKVFLKNVTITLKSVSDNDKNGKADISFSI